MNDLASFLWHDADLWLLALAKNNVNNISKTSRLVNACSSIHYLIIIHK